MRGQIYVPLDFESRYVVSHVVTCPQHETSFPTCCALTLRINFVTIYM